MLGKTLNLKSEKRGTEKDDFRFGFKDVYSEYGYCEAEVGQFCNRLRNGLYHLAATKEYLWIHNSPAISGYPTVLFKQA
jgi:hypothetical protein